MDAQIVNEVGNGDLNCNGNFFPEKVAKGENGMVESDMIMELLTRLDIDLAYSSEKLANLDLYMTTLSLVENDIGELSMRRNSISEVEMEKGLIYDLSFGYFDSEVTELGNFLNVLRIKIANAHQKLYSCRPRTEIFTPLQEKLRASQSSWKYLHELLSEMKKQLTNLGRTLSSFRLENTYSSEDGSLEISGWDLQTPGQQRLVLRMLEKSLASELTLEQQILESKEREEELQLKLLLANEVVNNMDVFSEVALERLLEAEHSSEVFMMIAKEMMSRLQILQFNLHCSGHREEELKTRIQGTLEQLKEKEIALKKIDQNSKEKETLEEKVKVLEQKLQSSEAKLQEVNVSYESSQEQLSVLEHAVESLREHVLMAESRAHNAESKLTALTEENLELKEEVGFLKGDDSHEEKVSLLEKQVRDMESLLQNARASSEASLEQQNMLYSAIWDMETLIEELKSKVSKAENRAENAEEQCLVLAETNLDLSKELGYLKSENEKLETSLKELNKQKVAWVKDINNGAKLVTEMVMQLATERERIQKQLSSLGRENEILLQELRKMRKNCVKAREDDKEDDEKEFSSNVDNPATGISIADASSVEKFGETPSSASASNQVDEPSEQNMIDEAEAVGSSTSDDDVTTGAKLHSNHENEDKGNDKHNNKKSYIFASVLILVLSVLAMYINWQKLYSIMRYQYLGLQ